MYKLKILFFLFLSLVFCGCSIEKMEYKAVMTTINDLKTPINKRIYDTIEIVDHSYKLDVSLLKGYKNQKRIILNNELKPSGNFFEWIDKKYAWIITDKEIDYMIQSIQKKSKSFWENRKFNSFKKTVKIVDYLKFDDRLTEDIERQKRIKEDKFVYFISKPVFNKNKDIFIIQYEIQLLPYSRLTLVYKKEKNDWIQIGILGQNW